MRVIFLDCVQDRCDYLSPLVDVQTPRDRGFRERIWEEKQDSLAPEAIGHLDFHDSQIMIYDHTRDAIAMATAVVWRMCYIDSLGCE